MSCCRAKKCGPFRDCGVPLTAKLRRAKNPKVLLLCVFVLLAASCIALAQSAPVDQTSTPASPPTSQGTAPQTNADASAPPAMAAPTVTPQPKPMAPLEPAFDEVHVQSRAEAGDATGAANAGAVTDPTLRTHTKPYRVDVDLVLVPVTIIDPMNRLVTGLDRENFTVIDNGQPQDIKHFSSEDAPISLGVLFDMSGSMGSKIDQARDAVVQFFKTANPQDEFFLIAFNDKPVLVADFTQSVDEVQNKLVYAIPKGRTSLLDAIYLGIAKMKQAKHQRRALLIISDGGDNHSRYTEDEIKSMVKEADVQIYAIGIFDSFPATEEERLGPRLLADVSEVTGGRSFTIDRPNELADVATKIGVELRNQYVLGYRPKNPAHDGKWRKIRVKLHPPKGLPPLTVYAKTGYYASHQ